MNWNLCMEHFLVQNMTLFPGGSDVFKAAWETQEWATNWSIKNRSCRKYHRTGEAYYSRWSLYLNSVNNRNLLPFTWYKSLIYNTTSLSLCRYILSMKNSVWKQRVQSGYPTSWQGHKTWRHWDVLNRYLQLLNRKCPIDWLMWLELKLWYALRACPWNRHIWWSSRNPEMDQ